MSIEGSITALVTPMKETGDLDFNALENLINFQRNFSDKYIKHFRDIKRGLIGKKLKIFCYYNRDFYSNATHLLNLVLLLGKKNFSLKKIGPTSLYFKSKSFELYFFNISEQYNHNSLVVFGSKGRFEFSSRPETGKIYLKYKDTNYKDVNILKLKRKVNFIEKHPQHNVLKDIYISQYHALSTFHYLRTFYWRRSTFFQIQLNCLLYQTLSDPFQYKA